MKELVRCAIAVDVGGTKIAAGLVDQSGAIRFRQESPTPVREGADSIQAAIITVAQAVVDLVRVAGIVPVGIGIGTGGHVDVDQGTIAYASDTLPGWAGRHLTLEVGNALGLPAFADNDVNALALGEHSFGAGRGYADVLYVAVGTGLGGALVRSGKLWRGSNWSAGEICHLVIDFDGNRRCSCGQMGHLEAYTSGPAIAQRYAELVGDLAIPPAATGSDPHPAPTITLREIADRARRGDKIAITAIQEGASILGIALAGVANLIDPEAIVIGGGVPQIGSLWWEPLTAKIRANPLPGPARVALLPARLGPDAALAGAGWLALSRVGVGL